MAEYRIEITNENISEDIVNLIEDYWAQENGKWKYARISDLSQKYSLNYDKITTCITENSKCIKTIPCPKCHSDIEKTVTTRGLFYDTYAHEVCRKCVAEQEQKEIEEFYKCSNVAIDFERWNELSYEELEILDIFLKYDRGIAFGKIFSNTSSIKIKDPWKKINHIVEIDLIYLKREYAMGPILEIIRPKNFEKIPIEEALEKAQPSNYINANNHSVALGNHSVTGDISLSSCQKELEHLKQLLEEKEKQIELLRNICELKK